MTLKALLAGLTLAAAVGAQAAPDAFDKYASNIAILQDKVIQKELKINEAQRAKLNKHASWFNGETKKLNDAVEKTKKPPTQADQKKLATLMNQMKDKVVAELSQYQLKRLREISLQMTGDRALLDPTVGKKVGLTDAQIKKLQGSYETTAKKMVDLETKTYKVINDKYAAKNPKTDAEKKKLTQEWDKEMAAAQKKIAPTLKQYAGEFTKSLNSTLSAAQKNKWTALLGKIFKPA